MEMGRKGKGTDIGENVDLGYWWIVVGHVERELDVAPVLGNGYVVIQDGGEQQQERDNDELFDVVVARLHFTHFNEAQAFPSISVVD